MILLCLAPIVLLGYSHTIQTSWHTSQDISGPMMEVQSCKEGLGGRIAYGSEWVQVGPQYGLSLTLSDKWSVTGQIHGGLGYSNTHHPDSHIRQVTKWNGGVSFMLQYTSYGIKVGYDHMSNGRGLDPTNHGQDMVSMGGYYVF